MKRSTAAWTVTATAAALLALPPASAAQSTAQPPAATQSAAQPPASAQGENAAAQEQLRQARTALNQVSTANLSARAKTQVAELSRRLTVLERNSNASAKTWGNEVAAMDKILGTLLAGDDTPTGTSGTTTPAPAKPTATLDEASRAKLSEVRTAITAYAAAMSGQPAPSATDPTATTSTATTTSATPTEPTATSAQPTTPAATASSQSTTPATQPPAGSTAQPPATETSQTQPDEQVARKHLTEARNTLSEMTQLPAAAQLSGDARTQVSQLISNFNELITTQTDWHASYAKVTANLTALLGPDTGATDPSSGSGTAGAVGTSGTATPNIDPAIRGKLVELRKNLAEFERVASGGGASSSSAAASSASPASASSSSSAAPSSASPSSATPSSTTTSASTPSTTAATSSSSDPAAGSTAAAPQTESLRLIAAIESMLKSQNEGGGLTLDKTQADMLRTHLADLKRLLEQTKK